MSEDHKPLPVDGYKPQSQNNVDFVNNNKRVEEEVLRALDFYKGLPDIDQRWLAIGRTGVEQAFMAINRAIFKPGRVALAHEAEVSVEVAVGAGLEAEKS